MDLMITAICLFGLVSNWIPTHITTQVGGYVGLLTAGAGYEYKNYTTDLLVGYVPAFIGGEALYSVTWKNQVDVYEWMYSDISIAPYFGISTIISLDDDSHLPAEVPAGYYPNTNVMWAPYLGVTRTSGSHSLFFEFTSLDFYLEAKVRNEDYLTWQDVTTYGFGYRYFIPSGELSNE